MPPLPAHGIILCVAVIIYIVYVYIHSRCFIEEGEERWKETKTKK